MIRVAFLAVPLLLWFRPWQYRLSVAGEVANHFAAVNRSSLFRPQTCATCSGVHSRTSARSASKPVVCAAM
ncbi:hypothetical protein D9M69_617130 [compost metagenome]